MCVYLYIQYTHIYYVNKNFTNIYIYVCVCVCVCVYTHVLGVGDMT